MSVTVGDLEVVHRPSLEELAARANAEHADVEVAIGSLRDVLKGAVWHAIRAGEALLAAKELVDHGGWVAWCKDNLSFSPVSAATYMRQAFYRADIELWLANGGDGSIEGARRHLRALPELWQQSPNGQRKAEAKRLRKQGMSIEAIADLMGVHAETIRLWTDTKAAAKRAAYMRQYRTEQQQAKKALEQRRRSELARSAGGTVAEAYSLMRRAALQLDAALRAASSSEERESLRAALSAAHKAEDAIVRALQEGRRGS